MKTARKLSCLILALAMIFSLATAAFATSTTTHTITVNHSQSGHTYTAYQVFVGEYSNGKLTNVQWGSGVKGDALLTALKALTGGKYTSCNTAEDVAAVLSGFANDSTELTAFANLVNDNLKTGVASDSGTKNGDKYDYKINVTGDGYYFIKDTGTVNDTEVATKYLLKVVGDETITTKPETVTIKKSIVGKDNKELDANSAKYGEVVNFKITSKLPDMANFTKFTFVVEDVLSKGLTFNTGSVNVTIGGNKYPQEGKTTADYLTVTSAAHTEAGTAYDGGTKVTINLTPTDTAKTEFAGLTKGAEVVITYTATVNKDATLELVAGNPNKARLLYSNNPKDFEEGSPSGKTPWSETKTFVTGMELIKIDGTTQKNLTGAEFEIEGNGNQIYVTKSYSYTEDANGTYWKLKNGTYTTVDPNGEGVSQDEYEDISKKYTGTLNTTVSTSAASATATVDGSGRVIIEGLGEGIYKITESKAPEGYNMLKEPIYIKVSATSVDYTNGVTWKVEHVKVKANATADLTKPENFETVKELSANNNHRYELTVENKQGTQLPSTGGVGTTMFYVLGSILTLGAVVLLVTKKRMSGNV